MKTPLLLLSLLCFLCACGSDETSITVEVNYEGPLPVGSELILTTSREMGGSNTKRETELAFPETLTVLPAEGSSGPITATATLQIGETTWADQGQAEFIEGEQVVLRLHLGQAQGDAGMNDGGTDEDDAAIDDDGGIEDDAGIDDAAIPEDGGPITLACDTLSTLDGARLNASAIASMSTPANGEFLAVVDNSVTRIFHRQAGEDCFVHTRTINRVVLTDVHLSFDGTEGLLIGTGTSQAAAFSVAVEDGSVGTFAAAIPGVWPFALGGSIQTSFGGSDPRQPFALAQKEEGDVLHIVPAVRVPPNPWRRLSEVRNHQLLATSGNNVLVQHNLGVAHWRVTGSTPSSDTGVFGDLRREVKTVRGSMLRDVEAAALIGGPRPIAILSLRGNPNVERCALNTDDDWSCATVNLPGATALADAVAEDVDGNGNHWTVLRGHGTDFAGYHHVSGVTRPLVLSNRPRAIASLSIGFAYIDARSQVIIRRR